ncbi:hypothetical protein REPUB_Repub06bG0151200 [Reevesia pubescens]
MWGVWWVSLSSPVPFYLSWLSLWPRKESIKLWLILFFSVVWSIWLCRNDIVFNGKSFDFSQIIFSIKFRLASWAKARWPQLLESFDDVFRCFANVVVPVAPKVVRSPDYWEPPPPGFLKFNVDGSIVGKPRPAGIGIVLRSNNGEFLLVFSRSIDVQDSNDAEFLTILEAFLIFAGSKWCSIGGLIVESDSLNAVKWFNNVVSIPWRLKRFSYLLESFKLAIPGWRVVHVLRERNTVADGLAKAGVLRSFPLLLLLE